MKKILLSAIIATTGMAALAPTAYAEDGQINFTGKIVGTTCTINGDAAPSTQAVTLPSVSQSSLSVAGSSAGRTPFSIVLSNCAPDTGSVHALFELGQTVNTETGRLIVDASDDSAKNVEIGLLNSKLSHIAAGAADGSQNTDEVSIAGGKATMNFFAQYESLGDATGGTANSRVQYTLMYQ
ncbi:fimbrial protein [Dyella sp. 20L07]|uniref:fimbrial protein n=1 Tax=Dyella sp. 20L07 TaxID=3384240 RepID=UPI003D29A491